MPIVSPYLQRIPTERKTGLAYSTRLMGCDLFNVPPAPHAADDLALSPQAKEHCVTVSSHTQTYRRYAPGNSGSLPVWEERQRREVVLHVGNLACEYNGDQEIEAEVIAKQLT